MSGWSSERTAPRRALRWAALCLTLLAGGCGGREPCDESASGEPTVVVGEAFQTCNHRPTAVISGLRSTQKRVTVTLNGGQSEDRDGEALSFAWSMTERPASSSATLTGAEGPEASFDTDASGRYRIELVTSDGELESDPAGWIVEVTNRGPTANAGPLRRVEPGETVVLDGRASSDPDADSLVFRWSFAEVPVGSRSTLVGPDTAEASFVPDARGFYDLELVVSDGEVDSEPSMVRILSGVSATPPIAIIDAVNTATVGDTVQLSGLRSSDPDGDALNFEWRIVAAPSGATAVLTSSTTGQSAFAPDLEGTWRVELAVDDGFHRDHVTADILVLMSSELRGIGRLDVNHVYFISTLVENGAGGTELLCDYMRPSQPSAGFTARHWGGGSQVRSSDGAYIYLARDVGQQHGYLRQFVEEPLRWDPDQEEWRYPRYPEDNDLDVATPACPGAVTHFELRPTGGHSYYCDGLNAWFDEAGEPVPLCLDRFGEPDLLLGHGYDGSTLCFAHIRSRNGVSRPLEPHQRIVHRARPAGGFWTVGLNSDTQQFERFVLHVDGRAEVDLRYGPFPPEVSATMGAFEDLTALDTLGRLYRLAEAPAVGRVIVRFPVDGGPGEIIYSEANQPFCHLREFRFVTGP